MGYSILEKDSFTLPIELNLADSGTLSFSISESRSHTVMLGLYRQDEAPANVEPLRSKNLLRSKLFGASTPQPMAATNPIVGETLVAVVPVEVAAGETFKSVDLSEHMSTGETYLVRAKAVRDDEEVDADDFTVGEVATSNVIYFIRPDRQLDAPTNIAWSNIRYGRAVWDEVAGADSYQVALYKDDEVVSSRNVVATHFDFSTGWIEFEDVEAGRYSFTVTAMSGDIVHVAHSVESERSGLLAPPESAEPAVIVTQPTSRYASLGKPLSCTLNATGLGLTYSWFVNGEQVTDHGDDTVVSIDSSAEGDIEVYCIVHDFFGNDATSDTAVIKVVDDRPITEVITLQPNDITCDPDGFMREFRCAAADAPNNFAVSYRWYEGHSDNWVYVHSGPSYSVRAISSNNGLQVKCHVTVTAPTGVTVYDGDSNVATLHVNSVAVAIEGNLKSDYWTANTHTIRVYATGEGDLSYAWYVDGNEQSGANTDTFSIDDLDEGSQVWCVVTGGGESVQSNTATIHTGANPLTGLTISPKSASVDTNHLAVGDSFVMTALATPSDTTSTLTWSSSDENVATVTDGVVQVVGLGPATITAGADGLSASYDITADSWLVTYHPMGGTFAEGGTADLTMCVVDGSVAPQPAIFLDGDTFLGWSADGDAPAGEVVVESAIEFWALWEQAGQQEDDELEIVQDLAQNQYAQIGTDALFEVVTNGAKVRSYQWMVNTGSDWEPVTSGVSSDGARTSLEVPATAANNGWRYKVVVTPARNGKPVESTVCTLTTGETETPQEPVPLTFLSQPVDVEVTEGEDATFTVVVDSDDVTYQWQQEDGVDIEGATEATLTLENVSLDMNGRVYRCVVTLGEDSYESATATLTVHEAPAPETELVFTTSPESREAHLDSTTDIVAAVQLRNGENYSDPVDPIEFTLQVLRNDEWVDGRTCMPGAIFFETAPTEGTVTVDVDWDAGTSYRLRVMASADGFTATSEPFDITSIEPVEVAYNFQPNNGVDLQWHREHTLTAQASLEGAEYYWYKRPGKVQIRSVVTPDGSAQPELVHTGSEFTIMPTADMMQDRYFCSVKVDGVEVNRAYFWLVVNDIPELVSTGEPEYTKYASVGDTVEFEYKAGLLFDEEVIESDEITYQWFAAQDMDSDWEELEGATDSVLQVEATELNEGLRYRAVARFSDYELWSEDFVYILEEPSAFTFETNLEEELTVAEGESVTLEVAVDSDHADRTSYEWFEIVGGGEGDVSVATGSSYTFVADASSNDKQFYCAATCDGETIYSAIVALTVEQATLVVTVDPASVDVFAGSTVTLTATAGLQAGESFTTLSDVSYEWQHLSYWGEWRRQTGSGTDRQSYITSVSMWDDGEQMRVKVTYGEQVAYSDPVTITVREALKFTSDLETRMVTTLGDELTMSVAANKEGASFEWYEADAEGENESLIGSEATISFTASQEQNGHKFRCVATLDTERVSSQTMTLTVVSADDIPESVSIITWQESYTPDQTGTATIDFYIDQVTGVGEDANLTYVWQKSSDTIDWEEVSSDPSYDPSANPAELHVPCDLTPNQECYYRVVVNGVASDSIRIFMEDYMGGFCEYGCQGPEHEPGCPYYSGGEMPGEEP